MPSLVQVLFHHAGCVGVARSLASFVERRSALALSAVALSAVPAAAQSVEWRRLLGTSENDAVLGSAPDGNGGVYVNGYTYGSLVGPSAGRADAWVIRYDAAGNRLWSRQFGTVRDEWSTAAASDGQQGVFVAGNTTGALGGPGADGGAWVARLDGAGTTLWIQQFDNGAGELNAAASDAAGGVLVAGRNSGGISSGLENAWLARFDAVGNQLWLKQLGTNADDGIQGIAEQAGGVYACGSTNGALGAPNAGQADAWLARFDLSGNQVWIRQFGTSKYDFAFSIAGDSVDGVYVCGKTHAALAGPHAGASDVWLARFDGSGNQLWIRQFGTTAEDWAQHAVQDGTGGVIVVGHTDRNLGGASLGDTDAWVARYDSSGALLWTKQLGSRAADWAMTAASAAAGEAYVGGGTDVASAGSLTTGDAWLARIAGP